MDIRPLQNNLVMGKVENIIREESPTDLKEKSDKFEQFLTMRELGKPERAKTLEQWIHSLEELKSRLENNVTKDNMNLYKDSVKKFLDYYVENDLFLKEHRTKDGLFYSKTIQIIKSADEKIDKLTEDLVSSQIGKFQILELTGEIQGMLFELIV